MCGRRRVHAGFGHDDCELCAAEAALAPDAVAAALDSVALKLGGSLGATLADLGCLLAVSPTNSDVVDIFHGDTDLFSGVRDEAWEWLDELTRMAPRDVAAGRVA